MAEAEGTFWPFFSFCFALFAMSLIAGVTPMCCGGSRGGKPSALSHLGLGMLIGTFFVILREGVEMTANSFQSRSAIVPWESLPGLNVSAWAAVAAASRHLHHQQQQQHHDFSVHDPHEHEHERVYHQMNPGGDSPLFPQQQQPQQQYQDFLIRPDAAPERKAEEAVPAETTTNRQRRLVDVALERFKRPSRTRPPSSSSSSGSSSSSSRGSISASPQTRRTFSLEHQQQRQQDNAGGFRFETPGSSFADSVKVLSESGHQEAGSQEQHGHDSHNHSTDFGVHYMGYALVAGFITMFVVDRWMTQQLHASAAVSPSSPASSSSSSGSPSSVSSPRHYHSHSHGSEMGDHREEEEEDEKAAERQPLHGHHGHELEMGPPSRNGTVGGAAGRQQSYGQEKAKRALVGTELDFLSCFDIVTS